MQLGNLELIKKWLEKKYAAANPLDYNEKAILAECLAAVKNTPTIEAEPVRHGQWKYTLYDRVGTLTTDGDLMCINCGERFFRVIGTWYKYCPNCGAKMDGDVDYTYC